MILCPLKFNKNPNIQMDERCEKEKCAWWVEPQLKGEPKNYGLPMDKKRGCSLKVVAIRLIAEGKV